VTLRLWSKTIQDKNYNIYIYICVCVCVCVCGVCGVCCVYACVCVCVCVWCVCCVCLYVCVCVALCVCVCCVCVFCVCVCVCVPGSLVGSWLDGPGLNPVGDEVLRPSRTALGPIQAPVKWVPGLSQGRGGRGVRLTPHLI